MLWKRWLERVVPAVHDEKAVRKKRTVKSGVLWILWTYVPKTPIKYVTVTTSVKISFWRHLEYAFTKVASPIVVLARMLPNVSGLKIGRSSSVTEDVCKVTQKQVSSAYRRLVVDLFPLPDVRMRAQNTRMQRGRN